MSNKFSQILKNKKEEVGEKKKSRDFLRSIINPKVGDISIISEIKLASPFEGKLGEEKEVAHRAILYEKGLADAISVVVDNKYFGGKLEFIKQIKEVVSLPILYKDFILDPYQVYEAKVYGADAVLLIAKILSKRQLHKFIKVASKLGIEPVVEVNDERELGKAIRTEARIIAVNARDLASLKIDLEKACQLIKKIPKSFIPLGFSGVRERGDIKRYRQAGAKAVLVGTALMTAQNIGEFIKNLKGGD